MCEEWLRIADLAHHNADVTIGYAGLPQSLSYRYRQIRAGFHRCQRQQDKTCPATDQLRPRGAKSFLGRPGERLVTAVNITASGH